MDNIVNKQKISQSVMYDQLESISKFKKDNMERLGSVFEIMSQGGYELISTGKASLMFYNGEEIDIIFYSELERRFPLLFQSDSDDAKANWMIKEMEEIEFQLISRLSNGLLFRRLVDEMDFSFVTNETIDEEFEADKICMG